MVDLSVDKKWLERYLSERPGIHLQVIGGDLAKPGRIVAYNFIIATTIYIWDRVRLACLLEYTRKVRAPRLRIKFCSRQILGLRIKDLTHVERAPR